MKKFYLFCLFFVIVLPSISFARIGVGVGSGSITMDEPLKAGAIYELPSLPVINTGDEAGEYEVFVTFLKGVPQLRPDKEWFTFSPKVFYLEPGETTNIKVTMTLPTKIDPGEYFAFLEARPAAKSEGQGGATIGVAAASKLYFTVAPSNIFQAIFYRGLSIYKQYYPYDAIVLGIMFFIILILNFKSKFNIQISTKKTGRSKK